MNTVRPAAQAGIFYPDKANELSSLLKQYLDAASSTTNPPKAIIVPHAGYIFSGEIAAYGYKSIQHLAIKKILLLGPAHREVISDIAAPTHSAFATPLGEQVIDKATISNLVQSNPLISYNDTAHQQDHALEVQLPFVQTLFPQATVIPLLLGYPDSQTVANLLRPFWDNPECMIVISSDLSHFLPYETAKARDKSTTQAIVDKAWRKITPEDACGCYAIRGLLALCQQKQATVEMLKTANSGDTAGDKLKVVGYGAYAAYV